MGYFEDFETSLRQAIAYQNGDKTQARSHVLVMQNQHDFPTKTVYTKIISNHK